jgi:hypothetical protein
MVLFLLFACTGTKIAQLDGSDPVLTGTVLSQTHKMGTPSKYVTTHFYRFIVQILIYYCYIGILPVLVEAYLIQLLVFPFQTEVPCSQR